MFGRAIAAGVMLALLLGCTQSTKPQSFPAAVVDPCAQLADETIESINDYLAEAGPSIEHAPRMPKGDWRINERRLRDAGCTDKEMFKLLSERAPQVEGDDELARYVQALLVAMA